MTQRLPLVVVAGRARQLASGDVAGGPRAFRTITGTSDTPTHADFGLLLRTTNASAVPLTLDSTQSFVAGDTYDVLADGAGLVSFALAGTDTCTPALPVTLRAQGSAATVTYLGSGRWSLVGDFYQPTGRLVYSFSSATTAGSGSAAHYVYLGSASAPLTLPTAIGSTVLYTVKCVDTGTNTVVTTSGQTIDGASTFALTQNQSIDLVSDGSNWQVL